jgi:hypothetical protein
MSKIVDYRIVSFEHRPGEEQLALGQLVAEVNRLIGEGWEPHGTPPVIPGHYQQAMVKRESLATADCL